MERSDGVLFLKFINKFHQSAQATAWVASLCSSVRLVLGKLETVVTIESVRTVNHKILTVLKYRKMQTRDGKT